MKEVKIRRVNNGFIVTVGEGENGDPAPQFVASDLDQLCAVIRALFEEAPNGDAA